MSASAVAAIGERLREARLRRGISVRGLARSVDVSASLISQIETGKSSPSVSTLYAITTALGISIEDVFGEPEADREAAAGPGGAAREVESAGGPGSPADAGGVSTTPTGAAGASPAGTGPGTSAADTGPGGANATGTGADAAGPTGAEADGGAMIAALAGLATGLAAGAAPGSPVMPAVRPADETRAEPAAEAPADAVPDLAYTNDAPAHARTSAAGASPTGSAPAADEAPAAGLGADRSGQSATAKGLRMLSQKRLVGPVVRADEREVLHLDSGVTWELLGQLPDTHVDFLRITYAPGGSSSSGGMLMRHSGTEFGHVLSGRLTLTLGFENYDLGPGDSVCFDSSTPHAYANHGTEPAVGVWFVLERFRCPFPHAERRGARAAERGPESGGFGLTVLRR